MTAAVELILDHFVLENGLTYGRCAEQWQREDFTAIFATEKDGRPSHRLCYIERRRGESKTDDAGAAALADLVTGPPGHRSYAVAADQEQAALILDSIRGFQSRSPILAGLEVGRNVVRNPASDSELRVMSSDDRTAYGIRPRKVWFDELSLQPDSRLWTSFWSSIGKRPDAQLVALSMAGFDFTSVGWQVRELASKNSSYYFASRQDSDLAPWLRHEDLEEQRSTLHPVDFARFWECRWTEAAGSWITREMYDQAERVAESTERIRDRSYFGFVDVGLVHDPTTIAVVHSVDDTVVLDTLRTIQGTRDEPVEMAYVEEVVVDLTERFGIRRWVFEAPQAVASVQRLQHRLAGRCKVEARYPTAESMARLFGGLYRLFSTGKLALYPHQQLRKEALNLVVRVVGGRMRVVESSSVHQDHVVALGGAAELAVARRESVIVPPVLMPSISVASILEGRATSDDWVINPTASRPPSAPGASHFPQPVLMPKRRS